MEIKKILIIQRQLPFYRVPLFENLLKSKKYDFYLITGKNDSVSGSDVELKNPKHFKMINKKTKIKNFEIWKHINLEEKIRKIRPDVVIIEAMVSNISNWKITRLKKKFNFKLIGWVCGYQNYTGKIKDLLLRKFFKKFDYFLAYHTAAKKFLTHYRISENKITILHNSTKTNFNYNKKEINKIKNKYSLKNKKIVLYVGRIIKSKKIEILLEAIKKLGDNYACLIVGKGDYLPCLKEKYKDIKNIKFVGEVIQSKENYFKIADVFALPGPGGLALNEALYHGLPIVSSLADGCAEDLVINDYNGFLIRKMSSSGLADKIKYIFNKNKKVLYAKNSLKLGKKFSFENFVKNFIRGVSKCLENSKNEKNINYCRGTP